VRIPEPERWAVVFRGVGEEQVVFRQAARGTAKPYSYGTASPALHNAGITEDSPFTSWTRSRDVAARYAGSGGVILVWPLGPPPEGAKWSWEWSPDVYFEQEVLIRGTIRGAMVIRT
jgi:hypothetical protein